MRLVLFFSLLILFGCRDKATCYGSDSNEAESAVAKKYGYPEPSITCLADDEEVFFCEHEPSGAKFRCAGSQGKVKCINWVWEMEE